MVYLVRKVVYQRIQGAAVLACAKIFEAMGQLDNVVEVSGGVLATAVPVSIMVELTG